MSGILANTIGIYYYCLLSRSDQLFNMIYGRLNTQMALGLLLCCALFTTSCKHDAPVVVPPDFGQGTGHCRLKGITHPNDTHLGNSRLFYDNDNRLIRVEHWGTGQPPGNTFT